MTRRIELLKALETTPRDLARTFKGIDPTMLGTRKAPDQWSFSDVMNHLLSVEIRYLVRLQRVAQEDNPRIRFILPDEANHDLTLPLDNLLNRFTEVRTQTLQFLHPLSSGIWARPATFESGENTTFRYLVQALVDHDTEHLNQIVEIKYS
jgi:hypothetical protein